MVPVVSLLLMRCRRKGRCDRQQVHAVEHLQNGVFRINRLTRLRAHSTTTALQATEPAPPKASSPRFAAAYPARIKITAGSIGCRTKSCAARVPRARATARAAMPPQSAAADADAPAALPTTVQALNQLFRGLTRRMSHTSGPRRWPRIFRRVIDDASFESIDRRFGSTPSPRRRKSSRRSRLRGSR